MQPDRQLRVVVERDALPEAHHARHRVAYEIWSRVIDLRPFLQNFFHRIIMWGIAYSHILTISNVQICTKTTYLRLGGGLMNIGDPMTSITR